MKKRKLKPGIKIFIVLLVLGIIGFGAYKLGFINKAVNLFKVAEKAPKKEKEKEPDPVLQIVDETSDSRIIAVSINNYHAAWPQTGLQDSFLNYELVAEGGITRILAFFKDADTAKIGSVRSARHYFLDYIMENDAIFVHFGHSPQALSDISKFDIDNINGMYTSAAFWRDEERLKTYSWEHTAFTSMKKINKVIASKKFRNTSDKKLLLNYSIPEVDLSTKAGAIKADKVKIVYSGYTYTYYTYDSKNKVYLRSMAGEKHIDEKTEKQYTTKNIITYQVTNYSIDSDGRQDLKNVGSGTGYYISNGYAVPIKWSKTSRSAQTVYTYLDGKEIEVNDGNTWIQIQPTGKALSIKGNETATTSSAS